MGWTTTFDASHKVRASGGHAVTFMRHIARDEDAANGFVFGHSNKGIDASRSHLNRTMVNDGSGGYRVPVVTTTEDGVRPPSAELGDYLDSRLATVKKPLRKDAVVARPLVFKLDPAWYDEHCPDWRENGLNEAALALHDEALKFAERFGGGQQNIVGYSDHLDEAGYPERQIVFTPVTDDGRLSQKDYFPNPAAMKRMHKELREHLRATCGYDADMRVADRSTEHLNSRDFSAMADRIKRTDAKSQREWKRVVAADAAVLKKSADVAKESAAVTARALQIGAAERAVEDERRRLDEERERLRGALELEALIAVESVVAAMEAGDGSVTRDAVAERAAELRGLYARFPLNPGEFERRMREAPRTLCDRVGVWRAEARGAVDAALAYGAELAAVSDRMAHEDRRRLTEVGRRLNALRPVERDSPPPPLSSPAD